MIKKPPTVIATESKYHHTKENILHEEQEIRDAIEDISKFSVLYDRYYIPILRFVLQRTASDDVAADITSQVFLKAMGFLGKYQFKGLPFASWLYRVASNEITMEYRKNNIERVYNVSSEQLMQVAEEVDDEAGKEMIQAIVNSLNILSPDEMTLVEMRYFEKRQFNEIAQILEENENTLKVRMHRTIIKLREYLIKKEKM